MRGVSRDLVETTPQMSQILSLVPFKWPLQDTLEVCLLLAGQLQSKREKEKVKKIFF